MPVEADRVANPLGIDLQIGAIRRNAGDFSVGRSLRLAHVTGRTNRHIQPPVWPKADELPTVMAIAGIVVVDDNRFWQVRQAGLDIVIAQDAVDLGHVQRPVAESYAVGRVHASLQRQDLIGPIVLVTVYDGVQVARPARTHEQRPVGAEGH